MQQVQHTQQQHKKLLIKYVRYLDAQKQISNKRLVHKLISKVCQSIYNFIMFVPKIFLEEDSEFIHTFTKQQTYAILSSSPLPQAIIIAADFKIPLVILYWSGDQKSKIKIETLLQEYEIANFLNQSFVVYGLIKSDKHFYLIQDQINKGDGIYFARKNIFAELQCYAFINFDLATKENQFLELMKHLKLNRKIFYNRTEFQMQIQNEIKKSGGSKSQQIEQRLKQSANNFEESKQKYIDYLQNIDCKEGKLNYYQNMGSHKQLIEKTQQIDGQNSGQEVDQDQWAIHQNEVQIEKEKEDNRHKIE